MKKVLLTLTVVISFVNAYSQNLNPYEQFGYTTKYEYVRTKKDDGLYLSNPDSTAINKNLLINLKSKQIFILDANDSTVWCANIPEDVLTRFISVDPLTKKYPQLTPYQFASNTPIQAIDLDGLEAFVTHGTLQGFGCIGCDNQGFQVNEKRKQEVYAEFARISGNNIKAVDDNFRWQSPLNNGQVTREIASAQLVAYIIVKRQEMISQKTITDQEPITLIGYSHGGNVDFQAAGLLNKVLGVKVNVLTISTPPYNGNNMENPATIAGINEHVNIVHANDPVPDLATGGGGSLFKNPNTKNFVVQPSDRDKYNGYAGAHVDFPKSLYFADYLKQLPAFQNTSSSIPSNNKMNQFQNMSADKITKTVYKAAGLPY